MWVWIISNETDTGPIKLLNIHRKFECAMRKMKYDRQFLDQDAKEHQWTPLWRMVYDFKNQTEKYFRIPRDEDWNIIADENWQIILVCEKTQETMTEHIDILSWLY